MVAVPYDDRVIAQITDDVDNLLHVRSYNYSINIHTTRKVASTTDFGHVSNVCTSDA